jgi:cytochrome b561
MPDTKQIKRYNTTAIIIHWLMAIMIVAMICLGLYMVGLEKGSDERSYFFALHKSIGLTLALLALFRLIWKIRSGSLALPDYVKPIQRKMATATHHLLYLMLFLQPVTGYISSSFSGYKTKFWGIPLPHWGWKNQELNHLFSEIHEICAFTLIALIVVHIAGAFYHIHKKEKDLFRRMWFG